MSFFSDEQKSVGTEFESGGNFELIPANTGCLAAIQGASWAEWEGDNYINIRWQVVAPEDYKNIVVFQKLRVLDDDPKKADRAKRMLAAIDANAGGKLVAAGREPTDADLAGALIGKIMAIKVQVWKMDRDGEERTGNWVSAVAASGKKAQQQPAAAPVEDALDADSIPF